MPIYSITRFKHVVSNVTFINWVIFASSRFYLLLNKLFAFQTQLISSLLPDDIEIDENEKVAISSWHYLKELDELIEKTPKRTLVNFIFWRIVDIYSGLLGVPKKYINQTTSRSKMCFNFVVNSLPISVNARWSQKHFIRHSKNEVSKIVESVKNELKQILSSADWLDEETRIAALEKLRKMIPLIGCPEEYYDDKKIQKVYENFTIGETKFLEAVLDIHSLHVHETFKKLHKQIDRKDWLTHSDVTRVNAFYFAPENSIRE
jgi:neprilysin